MNTLARYDRALTIAVCIAYILATLICLTMN